MLLVLVTYLTAQFIAFNFSIEAVPWASVPSKSIVIWSTYATGFLLSKSYVGVVRHSGSKDFERLALATARLRVVGMPRPCIASLMRYSRSMGPNAARPSPRRE